MTDSIQMQNKKIAFITLGCKLNYAETSTYERKLAAEGFEAVSWNKGADIFLVNTCSVTEHSDKKSRNIIRKLHRLSPEAPIFVTGCYAQLKKEEIERIEGVRRVFGADEKGLVVPYITDFIKGTDNCSRQNGTFFPAYSSGERTRSFLKVQDGCDYKCAYCTVPYARGESRNIPISQIIPQAEAIAADGIKEIVLTGVNTGDFGRSTGESFFDLIKKLNEVEGIERYRISSIEPNLLTDEMIDWITSGTKFLPHYHIPLQSGSDRILKEMGRRYDTRTFADKIRYIRERSEMPGGAKVFFGVDVIVGFPGETDSLFMETYEFLKNVVKPAFIHIFPYSPRKGTPAAIRKDQVQDCIKTKRVQMLEELSAELHADFIKANEGVKENVLFESTDRNGMMEGYTGNYIRVSRPYDPHMIGRITEVTL
ncbi:MAG: tRNA (N(6)-L-threonylcarbamoyladenosine(37)-C(2))-methylthiotransferase MtaB [Bacteroidales bacterium]|nr:tRNA (N(6)-L-threonylcarbamoyladenosine(37)-C(2))-methylthiotransferase MtaB [Bacteroidales bacterium]